MRLDFPVFSGSKQPFLGGFSPAYSAHSQAAFVLRSTTLTIFEALPVRPLTYFSKVILSPFHGCVIFAFLENRFLQNVFKHDFPPFSVFHFIMALLILLFPYTQFSLNTSFRPLSTISLTPKLPHFFILLLVIYLLFSTSTMAASSKLARRATQRRNLQRTAASANGAHSRSRILPSKPQTVIRKTRATAKRLGRPNIRMTRRRNASADSDSDYVSDKGASDETAGYYNKLMSELTLAGPTLADHSENTNKMKRVEEQQ